MNIFPKSQLFGCLTFIVLCAATPLVAQEFSNHQANFAANGAIVPVSFRDQGSGCSACGCEPAACGCAAACEPTCCQTCGSQEAVCGCAPACCDPCATSCCPSDCGDCFLFGDADPFTVFPQDGAIRAGGWFQIGYHTGGQGGSDGLFNNLPNQVQLQQGWAYLERPLDMECKDFDWGFRVDYVYGTDGQDTQAFGQPTGWDTSWDHGAGYGHAIPQLYAEFGWGDLSLKLGHFFTIMGYEVIPAPDNFFYSKSVTMVRAEPFTHTGALFTYQGNEWLTLYGGWTAGWDTGFARNGGNTFLGGFTAQLFDNLAFTYTTSIGDFGFNFGGLQGSDQNGYAHSCVLVWDVTEKLHYICQSDFIDNNTFLNSGNELIGLNQYLIYDVNDCIGLGVRYEYFDDPRQVGNDYELTLGMNYRPHANMVFRPEFRLIEGDDAFDAFFPPRGLFGIDCIVTW